MRKVRIDIAVVIFLILPIILVAEEKPVVHLAGLRVVGPGYGLNGTELRAFHQQSGTTLALVIEIPENRKIVQVDDDKCSLVEFTDNHGNNLLDGVQWGGFPTISENSSLALIEVSSKIRPSQDAIRIHALGTIRLRIAASSVTEKIENLKLQTGTEAHVQEEVIEVIKVQPEDEGLTLVLQISRNLRDNMKDIRFYTVDGDPVEIWGQGSFTFGSASQMEYNLNAKSIPEALKVEFDLWKELEDLDVSFEISSGLGF
ncbi:hypothetical protein JXQ31_06005 [candidate division KSB1 bacterium]|nr:hypothetical protein [candidate division KSB1 bacterium]